MKTKLIFGIMLCSLFAMPPFFAAVSASSNRIKNNSYWSKPRSFWTPANAQKQLEGDPHQSVCVRIYGGGRLWHRLTGQPTYAETVRHSQIDPQAEGILIRNKQLIRLMPSLLRSSDQVLEGKYAVQGDTITIGMYKGLNQYSFDGVIYGFDYAEFLWWQSKAYCYRPRIGDLEMRPGDGTRFDSFIRQMAHYAREHRRGVSFYRYSVYELNPT